MSLDMRVLLRSTSSCAPVPNRSRWTSPTTASVSTTTLLRRPARSGCWAFGSGLAHSTARSPFGRTSRPARRYPCAFPEFRARQSVSGGVEALEYALNHRIAQRAFRHFDLRFLDEVDDV